MPVFEVIPRRKIWASTKDSIIDCLPLIWLLFLFFWVFLAACPRLKRQMKGFNLFVQRCFVISPFYQVLLDWHQCGLYFVKEEIFKDDTLSCLSNIHSWLPEENHKKDLLIKWHRHGSSFYNACVCVCLFVSFSFWPSLVSIHLVLHIYRRIYEMCEKTKTPKKKKT